MKAMKLIFLYCSLFLVECFSFDTLDDDAAAAVNATHFVGVKGKCPDIEFVKDFNIKKMLDGWYSIQETGKEIPCVHYHLEETRTNHYHGHLYPANVTIELDPKNVENFTDGYIVTAKFDSTLDQTVMKVFATDYESYAGIFTCKEFEDIHYPHIAFWSRSTTLDDDKIKAMSDVLAKYEGIDLSTLKKVKQNECSY